MTLDWTGLWSAVIVFPPLLAHFLCVSCSDSSVRLNSEPNVEPVGLLHLADLLKTSAPSKSSDLELSRRRSKRSVFLQPGVRICSQESIDEVLASHQTYYQLRGCLDKCFPGGPGTI
ncbi:hypothetical protein AMECASPLE_028952 [Ameca splendens]|uniref:Uncharacterized protein n=1 Tax=Ameca splendens TaxID=208324 RepID=A0ABV0Z5I0_9TELE